MSLEEAILYFGSQAVRSAARRMRRDGYHAGSLWLWLDIRNDAWFGQRELHAVQDGCKPQFMVCRL